MDFRETKYKSKTVANKIAHRTHCHLFIEDKGDPCLVFIKFNNKAKLNILR